MLLTQFLEHNLVSTFSEQRAKTSWLGLKCDQLLVHYQCSLQYIIIIQNLHRVNEKGFLFMHPLPSRTNKGLLRPQQNLKHFQATQGTLGSQQFLADSVKEKNRIPEPFFTRIRSTEQHIGGGDLEREKKEWRNMEGMYTLHKATKEEYSGNI